MSLLGDAMTAAAAILARQPMERLPAVRFFEPAPAFLDWAVERWLVQRSGGAVIYDVGAGLGQVTMALRGRDLAVIPIDLFAREGGECPVLRTDGMSMDYLPDSVVLLCRPCHGMFVEEVATHARQCGVREVVYVGFPHKLEGDAGVWTPEFAPALEHAGAEEETVFVCDWRGHAVE